MIKKPFYFLLFVCFNPVLSLTAQENIRVNWLSFGQLSDSLSQHPKPTILFFETDWCVYCKKMEKEVFANKELAELINKDFYAVQMDAESTDTIHFDGRIFRNSVSKKRRGSYHELAELLAQQPGGFSAPVLLVLDENFITRGRYFEYLDSRRLLQILKKESSTRR